MNRRVSVRWLAPLVAAAVVAGAGAVVSAVTSAAHADLAPRPAASLLADVGHARLHGLSGTISESADLGIPALPGLDAGPGSSTSLSSLISGSHTLRLWYAGPERVRLALLADKGESDLVKNGRSLWLWSSSEKSATHWLLPSAHSAPTAPTGPQPRAGIRRMTPQQSAEALLNAISPSTRVATKGTTVVADRPAYVLSVTPRSPDTLVDSVQIAIDGATHVPTRVQVFAKHHGDPVFETGFTSFDPTMPAASRFAFDPPPGTKVTQKSAHKWTHRSAPKSADRWSHKWTHRSAQKSAERWSHKSAHEWTQKSTHKSLTWRLRRHSAAGGQHGRGVPHPTVVGSGWSSVVVLPASAAPRALAGGTGKDSLSAVLGTLRRVSGSWGSGRLLSGTLFSAVVTDDGRVAVGAVPPHVLYAALAQQ